MDIMVFATQVGFAVSQRKIKIGTRDLVYSFHDHGYMVCSVQGSGTNATIGEGFPTNGSIIDFVDDKLVGKHTLGFRTDSRTILDHLQATGKFELKGGTSVKYRRNGRRRVYYVI